MEVAVMPDIQPILERIARDCDRLDLLIDSPAARAISTAIRADVALVAAMTKDVA